MSDDLNAYGKSNLNVIPRGNYVLIKISFEISTMAVINNKPIENDESDKYFEVCGIGPLVKGLEIGDRVCMVVQQGYDNVTIPENKQSLEELQKLYASMTNSERAKIIHNKETSRVNVITYGLFPEFQIKAILR